MQTRESALDPAEVDLIGLWRLAWRYKFVIIGSVVVCTTAALILAFTSVPIFRAQVVIVPVENEDMSGISRYADGLGGFATLAGINLSRDSSDVVQAKAVLGSRRLVEEFIERYQIADQLLPEDSGNKSLWFAVNRFRDDVIDIRDEPSNSTIVVTVDWTDPKVVAEWANGFVALANEFIRERARADSTRNIEYVNQQLANTSVNELRRVLYNLIETETRTLMLANAREEYAFSVIDPAVPPEVKVYPQRSLMLLIGAVVGSIVGLLLAFLHRITLATRSRV